LTGIAGKDMFRNNTGRVGLAGNNIINIKARADTITGINITITI
jgi:hypothetical protein